MKAEGYEKIYLYVFRNNLMARKFYEKKCFININETLSFNLGSKEILDLLYNYIISLKYIT